MVVRPHRVFLRRPAIRTLVMLWAGSALLTWAILVGGWFVARHHLVRIDTQVVDDIRGLDATRRLESALLVFRHDELPGMSDAVKHSPPHTCVTLRVEREDSQAVLSISDQGPGISVDDQKILFQPFGRGRSANTLAEGSGIGLYVVKQIVEAHAGRIEVHSEPGQGATFQIRLPLAPTLPTANRPVEAGVRTWPWLSAGKKENVVACTS